MSPSDAGICGDLVAGLRPFPSTPEIEIAARGSFSRFFGSTPARWVRSVASASVDIRFYPDLDNTQRLYLILGAGMARADMEFTTVDDPYGCIGVGAEVIGQAKLRYIVELRLSDLSNSTYGDLRTLSLTFGLRL
jgi:hypothetical protein